MPKQTRSGLLSVFPLLVSICLLVLTAVLTLFIVRLQSRVFVSRFDRTSLDILIIIVLTLSFVWLLILLLDSFGLSVRKLYRPLKWLLFFVYYPLGRALSWIFRIRKESYQTSFLSFQNRMFLSHAVFSEQSRLLLLLPHCLQFHDCKIRITRDISDCAECGKCDICNLKQLGTGNDLQVGIANGGTLARKIVHDARPDIIIAVACHRDLTDGVRESWKYPVYAILNERPNGPCFDTRVDVGLVENIIRNTKHTK
ncbi:MAG: DUF116 domain-containing protein [Candidatus Cloacimonadaceae bacterium]